MKTEGFVDSPLAETMATTSPTDAMDVDPQQPLPEPDNVALALQILRRLSSKELELVKGQLVKLQNEKSPFFRLPAELRNLIYTCAVRAHLEPLVQDPRHNWLDIQHKPVFFNTCRQIRKECQKLFPMAPFRVLVERNSALHSLSHLPSDWLSYQVGLSGLSRMNSEGPCESVEAAERWARSIPIQEGHSSGVVVFKDDLKLKPKAWWTYETTGKFDR